MAIGATTDISPKTRSVIGAVKAEAASVVAVKVIIARIGRIGMMRNTLIS